VIPVLLLLSFSQSLSDDYTGQWTNPLTLEITIIDATIDSYPEVGVFRVTVKESGNLKDAAGTSLASVATSPLLHGSFGQAAGPAIKSIVAHDPFGKNVGFGNDDTITINFLEPTNLPAVATSADLDKLFTFSQSLGSNYVGTWLDPTSLEITITDTTGNGSPVLDDFRVIVKQAGNLKNTAGVSFASTVQSPPLEASFGKKVGPTIESITVSDPDGADAIFGNGDIITVKFSEPTNRPAVATKANLDALLSFSLGDDYTGFWANPSTLIITITDTTNGSTVIGESAFTMKAGGNLKNAAGTSEISTSASPLLIGHFDNNAGPDIKSVVADDPDDGDSVYSNGDTITVRFSEPTNQPAVATRVDLDNTFTFTQNIGDGYTGEWVNSMTVKITITDATTDQSPQIGVVRVIVKESANLKNAAGTSLASIAVSPYLGGKFGTFSEIIPTTEGATATTTLPSGIIASLSLPSGQTNTLTMQRFDFTGDFTDSLIAGILGTLVNITPDQNTTPCSEAEPCPIGFIFNLVDAQAIDVDPLAVKILHDKNDDGDFDDAGEIDGNTIITKLDANTYEATSTITSFSNFGIGKARGSSGGSSGGSSSGSSGGAAGLEE